MAQQQYSGMFGPTPWEIEQQRQQQGMMQDYKVAAMTPGQAGVFNSAQAGRVLGGAINQGLSALGVPMAEDEQMANARKMQAINKELQNSGISPADTEKYLTNLGEKLAAAGLTKEAMNVSTALEEHRLKKAELDTKKYDSETARIKAEAFRSSKLKSSVSQEIFKKNKEYSPASLQKYLESITDATPDGDLSVLEPFKDAPGGWDSDGLTPDGRFVFTDKEGRVAIRQGDKMVPYDGPIAKGKNSSNVNVSVGGSKITVENQSPKPPDAFSTVGAGVAANVTEANYKSFLPQYEAATRLEPKVKQMRDLVDNGKLITGSFSDFRKEATRLAGTLGLGTPADVARMNDSDLYDKFVNGTIVATLSAMPGSSSNEELKMAKAAAETRQWNPATIKRALAAAEVEINRVKKVNDSYNEGLDQGRRDNYNFDWTAGKWRTKAPIAVSGDEGKSKAEVETKGADPRNPPPGVVPEARTASSNYKPVAPTGNPKFESAVDKYMVRWGMTREQTIERLLAEKAKQGGQ